MSLFVHVFRRQVLSTIAHIMSTPIAAVPSMWSALTPKSFPNEDGACGIELPGCLIAYHEYI